MSFPQTTFPDNQEAFNAFNLAEHTNKAIYITGKAGTGKSTFLKQFCKQTKKKFVILAPTGIAALNAGGQTIHSFFNLPTRPVIPNDPDITLFNERRVRNGKIIKEEDPKRKIIKELEMIIIDEISMVRADVIDAIDASLRKNGGDPNLPFGGKQMVFIGDLFQLEPIVRDTDREMLKQHYKGRFFFNANAFNTISFSNIEFVRVYRQTDKDFIEILERVRTKRATPDDFSVLNESFKPGYEPGVEEVIITLCPTNQIADAHNETHLRNIPEREFVFEGGVDGNFNEKDFPVPRVLTLKLGAQIMFVKNDSQGRWVNGTIGKVIFISEDSIKVRIKTEDKHTDFYVERSEWQKFEYKYNNSKNKIETEETGTFEQYPIKLAWAITIHKSQGLTFENVVIDPGNGMFAHGQLYVALSRCTTMQGLIFRKKISPREMIVHERVIQFAGEANNQIMIDKEFLQGVLEQNTVLKEMNATLKTELEQLRKELEKKELEMHLLQEKMNKKETSSQKSAAGKRAKK